MLLTITGTWIPRYFSVVVRVKSNWKYDHGSMLYVPDALQANKGTRNCCFHSPTSQLLINSFHIHGEQNVHSRLVENYGLNMKHIFLIMVVLYRVLSLERNVFKLDSYKDRTMRALTRSFKLRSYAHTALISNNGTVIQGVSLECNMLKLVPCKERA
jgi:hypothetical protein